MTRLYSFDDFVERKRVLFLLVLALFAGGVFPDLSFGNMISLISVAPGGLQESYVSGNPSVSADGRYVVFSSGATKLVAGDTNDKRDVFVYDRQGGAISRASVATGGVQANGSSDYSSISADGRYVAFESDATNLVPGDTNGKTDVFVHDRLTGTTTCVSIAAGGSLSNGWSGSPSISADGRYVAFSSNAANLDPTVLGGKANIFVHDRATSKTSRVSFASGEMNSPNADSLFPSISANGLHVAYVSLAQLAKEDSNGKPDIYVVDLQTGTTTRASVPTGGTLADGYCSKPSISADGRYVAFYSKSSNLVPGGTNGNWDVFVHDRQTVTTARVGFGGQQPAGFAVFPRLSADGRYVAFSSAAANLVPGDTNGKIDIFVFDRQTGATTRISIDATGAQANNSSYYPSISADGRYVAFSSDSSNLVPGDTNGTRDVFLADTQPSTPSTSGSNFRKVPVSPFPQGSVIKPLPSTQPPIPPPRTDGLFKNPPLSPLAPGK